MITPACVLVDFPGADGRHAEEAAVRRMIEAPSLTRPWIRMVPV
jgi:hypothetical protein